MRLRSTALCVPTLVLGAVLVAGDPTACAVSIKVDYSFDANGFFGAGNPGGPAAGAMAHAAVEAAASYFSGILSDTLAVIQTPAPFTSPRSVLRTRDWGGVKIWTRLTRELGTVLAIHYRRLRRKRRITPRSCPNWHNPNSGRSAFLIGLRLS